MCLTLHLADECACDYVSELEMKCKYLMIIIFHAIELK